MRKLDKNEIVIDTIINLAHRMGFKIVAEGVETEKQYAKLKELDCDYIQGYFFSKPLPVNDFEEYILEKNYNLIEGVGENGGYHGQIMLTNFFLDNEKDLEA